MSTLNNLMHEINEKVEDLMNEEFREVKPKDIGLDVRSGYCLFINEDYIAVRKCDRRPLDYYGGFEYVDDEHVAVLGDFVFYSSDDERIQGHLDEFFNPEKEEM